MSIRTRLSLLAMVFIAPLLGVLHLDKAANGGAQLLSGLEHVALLHGTKTAACSALLGKKFA